MLPQFTASAQVQSNRIDNCSITSAVRYRDGGDQHCDRGRQHRVDRLPKVRQEPEKVLEL